MIAADATPPAITAAGVGTVALGSTYATLRRSGRIATLRHGCELAGASARSARLRAPLRGSVDFTHTTPRRVQTITIVGGATASGVGVGATRAEVRRAFPHATAEHGSEQVFGITLFTVPRRDGGRFQFAVETDTGRVTQIGIPAIPLCD
jgi:hypothetical protein